LNGIAHPAPAAGGNSTQHSIFEDNSLTAGNLSKARLDITYPALFMKKKTKPKKSEISINIYFLLNGFKESK
jgi:hypothetical protein